MRFVVYLLTALCLSALSFSAAANARADTAVSSTAAVDAMPASFDEGVVDAVELPGDDPLEAEEMYVDDSPPPGYCNIWSADLLDPLDLLDEIEESSALFVLPTIPPVEFPVAQHVTTLGGRAPSRPDGLLRPPNSRA